MTFMHDTKTAPRVRFPPSPTGYCHVGTARMALINFLFARKHGGSIVFRSEDTDKERSSREYEEDILESITWLGLSWDEFYRQSERLERHRVAIERLVAEDMAYISKEESKREPGTEVRLVRLRNAGKSITFTDIVRGDITFDTTELGDFVIARTVDDPLYHLAVVVDDAEMAITHVIRGEEHISNTPRQILIQEALGYERPQYAHYPLFLSPARSKLSKRKGETAVREYRVQGFIAEALLNFIGTLGWTPPSGREVLSLAEMVEEFDLKDLHKSGAVFDSEKLRWFNRQYLGRMDTEHFALYAMPLLQEMMGERLSGAREGTLQALLPIVRERISIAADIRMLVESGEFDAFVSRPALEAALIPEKKSTVTEAQRHLGAARSILEGVAESEWATDSLKAALWGYATDEGRGAVLWPLRYALSGRVRSPDPFVIAAAIGKEETLSRIGAAHNALRAV